MPVPELEALIYLYETFQRHQQPSCAQAIQHLLSLAGLPDDAPRCKVPDSIGVGSAHQLLTPFTAFIDGVAGNQPEGVLAVLTGEDWSEARERGVAVDALLLLLAFIATDPRPARVRLAFWALDREGKGYLTRQQAMRAVDPLIAVARVGALLQVLEAGRPASTVHQMALGAPATRKVMYNIIGRSLDPDDPSRPTTLTQPSFDQLLDHTAAQLSTLIFQQATTTTPPPRPPSGPPGADHSPSTDPRRSTDPFHMPLPPRPTSPGTPSHPPPTPAEPDFGNSNSPGAETASTYRTTQEMLHGHDPGYFHGRHRRLSGGSRAPSSSTSPFGHDYIPEEVPDLRLDVVRALRPSQLLQLEAASAGAHQQLQGAAPMSPYHPPGLPRVNPTVQFEAPEDQRMHSGASLTAAAERAEHVVLQHEEMRRSSRSRRLSQRLNSAAPGAGMYASLQNTILDTSLQVFALCSGSLLLLLAVLFMNAALIVYLFRTKRMRLEVSLAVTVGFNLGLVAIIAMSIIIRAKCSACKAAAAAAQRRASDGHPEDIQLDGIIPPFLQPLIKRFLIAFNHENSAARSAPPPGGSAPGQPPAPDGLVSKLRAVWATVGRMAGFDAQAPSGPPASPYPAHDVRTPQSESPEFRNSGRHMSSMAVPPPMRSWNTLVPSNVVREAYRDF